MNDLVVNDKFDEIFFAKHGVGDFPVSKDMAAVRHQIDPTMTTAQEHEFCRLIIKGDNQTDAYIKAFGFIGNEYPRTTFAAYGSRLLQRPRVATALYDMQQKVRELNNEDIAQLVHELNADRKLARDLGQPAAAISAVKAKAALLGLDNSNAGNTNITINMSDSQKRQILERVSKTLIQKDAIEADYKDVTSE